MTNIFNTTEKVANFNVPTDACYSRRASTSKMTVHMF